MRKVVVLVLTSKENCPDYRNNKVVDIIELSDQSGIKPEVVYPWIDPEVVKEEYRVDLVELEDALDAD